MHQNQLRPTFGATKSTPRRCRSSCEPPGDNWWGAQMDGSWIRRAGSWAALPSHASLRTCSVLYASTPPSYRSPLDERRGQASCVRLHGRRVGRPLRHRAVQPPVFRVRPRPHHFDPVCPGDPSWAPSAAMLMRERADPLRSRSRSGARRFAYGFTTIRFQAWSCETNRWSSAPAATAFRQFWWDDGIPPKWRRK